MPLIDGFPFTQFTNVNATENLYLQGQPLGSFFQPVAPTGALYLANGATWQNSITTSSVEIWAFLTNTDPTDPTTGRLKANNADLSLATEIYISDTSFSQLDTTDLIERLGRGDQVVLRQYGSPSQNVVFRVSDFTTDNGDYFTVPIEYESGVTTFPQDTLVQLQLFELGDRKADVAAITTDTILLSADSNNPSIITGLAELAPPNGIEIDATLGAFRNIKGRTIVEAVGEFSLQFEQLAGGNGFFYIASERSTDGITWTYLPRSLRTIQTGTNTNIFTTSISGINDWLDGEYVRFRMYTAGNTGQLDPGGAVFEGVNVGGFSLAWTLQEL